MDTLLLFDTQTVNYLNLHECMWNPLFQDRRNNDHFLFFQRMQYFSFFVFPRFFTGFSVFFTYIFLFYFFLNTLC